MNAFVYGIETKVAACMLSACIIANEVNTNPLKMHEGHKTVLHTLPYTLEMLSLSLQSSITLLKTKFPIFCFVPTAIKRPYLKSRAENRKFCNG